MSQSVFILNICVKQTLQWITAGSDKMLTHEAILMLYLIQDWILAVVFFSSTKLCIRIRWIYIWNQNIGWSIINLSFICLCRLVFLNTMHGCMNLACRSIYDTEYLHNETSDSAFCTVNILINAYNKETYFLNLMCFHF